MHISNHSGSDELVRGITRNGFCFTKLIQPKINRNLGETLLEKDSLLNIMPVIKPLLLRSRLQ